MMASSLSEDDNNSVGSFSDYSVSSRYSVCWDETQKSSDESKGDIYVDTPVKTNLVKNVINRQMYGRFTRHPKAKTERVFNSIHRKNQYALSFLIRNNESLFQHMFLGFTRCGQYFLSYTEKFAEDSRTFNYPFETVYDYELYIWKFAPGTSLKFVSQHKIFKPFRSSTTLDNVAVMQFPGDLHKIVLSGVANETPDVLCLTIITLPCSPKNCKHCSAVSSTNNDSINQGWCVKHGFSVHYMFSMSQPPSPTFDPKVSLGFPNHLVINTGHHIYILNVTTLDPPQANNVTLSLEEPKISLNAPPPSYNLFNDNLSEVSESISEHFGGIVDAILEDFSEYDLDSNEASKPFHELNISCEPLNVTGKSYHNTLVQNIFDPRIKRLQNTSKDYVFSVPQSSSQKTAVEKSKIDKKIAEKAYEFIEENEKYEKISLFRKKRLAEKKYEFSEDNSENIVPFNSLRRERRCLYRNQNRCIRSPDFNSLFLSPRSPGWRSPMQSPNSRSGQFSPSNFRNIYTSLTLRNSPRNSPHHSKSPVSPKDTARKFYVYSPSLDSDCSDSDSRLIMRTSCSNVSSSSQTNLMTDSKLLSQSGLLIVDPMIERPKWIKKIVRRYSNGDFENSSLLSGQSRDDFNIPIEIPLLVESLTEQHYDIVPDFKVDYLTEMQLIVTQRSFDCDLFVQKRAQALCSEAHLDFLHCGDYDIKIIYVCPLDGLIICQAVIKIGAQIQKSKKLENFVANFLFSWNILTDAFDIIEPNHMKKLAPVSERLEEFIISVEDIPTVNSQEVLVLDSNLRASKTALRDTNGLYEVYVSEQERHWRGAHEMLSYSESDEYL